MGNSSSSNSSSSSPSTTDSSNIGDIIVDGGNLEPQSHLFASSPQEFNKVVVQRLILDRKLAPFYLGLNDEPNDSTEDTVRLIEEADAQATSNLKDALAGFESALSEAETIATHGSSSSVKRSKEGVAVALIESNRDRLTEVLNARSQRDVALMTRHKHHLVKLYLHRSIECPICFLYYPPPLVHTRCCDQPICTECFAQIKRADPTATHLESEPAACPFCMEPNFGCVYTKIKDDFPSRPTMPVLTQIGNASSETPPPTPKQKARRKSFAHTEKHVVTTDQLHPDWQDKVDAIRAAVARRANRRIVFRQVGDRLVPVGITSGRGGDGSTTTMSTASLPSGFASQMAAILNQSQTDPSSPLSGREARRAARRRNEEMASFLSGMGVGGGPELEEMMVAEAIRLSMIEDEERKKSSAVDKGKTGGNAGNEGESLLQPETSEQGAARSTALSEAINEPLQRPSLPTLVPVISTSSVSSAAASNLGPSLVPFVTAHATAATTAPAPSAEAGSTALPSSTSTAHSTLVSVPTPSSS